MKNRFSLLFIFPAAALLFACKKVPITDNRSGAADMLTHFWGKDIYYNKHTKQIEISGYGAGADGYYHPARYTCTEDWNMLDSAVLTGYQGGSPPWSNSKFVETPGGNTFWIVNDFAYTDAIYITTIKKRTASGNYITIDSSIGQAALNDAIPSQDGGFALLFGCELDINNNVMYANITIKKYNEQGNLVHLVQSPEVNTSGDLGGWYFAMSFAEKRDGNYLVFGYGIDSSLATNTGWFCSDVLYEMDPQGHVAGMPHFFKKELQANETFNPVKYGKVFIMPDNSLRLASTIYHHTSSDVVIRKINPGGLMEWEQYMGRPDRREELTGAFTDKQGYLVCSGIMNDGVPPQFPFMFRAGNTGSIIQWQQYYANAAQAMNNLTVMNFMCTEGDNVYYLAGSGSNRYMSGYSLIMHRINPADGQIK